MNEIYKHAIENWWALAIVCIAAFLTLLRLFRVTDESPDDSDDDI